MDANYTGKQILERRKALGMTQKKLAEKLNITDKAVSKWERGLNFPDLGLMEELAKTLDTTSAALLGLECADQNELVTSLAQLSDQQLEDAHKDIKRVGWCCVIAAMILIIATSFVGSKVIQKSQMGYQLLQSVTLAAVVGGLYLLIKYREIKKWNHGDWLTFYGAVFPVALWNGIYFLTGYTPNRYFSLILLAVAAVLTQLLFIRIMRSKVIQALPVLFSIAYTIWTLWLGYSLLGSAIAAASCLVVWLIFILKK